MATWAPRELRIYSDTRQADSHADFYGGIAALVFVNDHLFFSHTTKFCLNFSNQTTTFFGKSDKILCPHFAENSAKKEFCGIFRKMGTDNFVSFSEKSGRSVCKNLAISCCRRHEKLADFPPRDDESAVGDR